MKKCLMLGASCAVVALLSGCALTSGYNLGGGYPGTLPGLLISDQSRGGMIHGKVESMKDMEVLGPVSSKVSASNVLLVCSIGDASIEAAKKIVFTMGIVCRNRKNFFAFSVHFNNGVH